MKRASGSPLPVQLLQSHIRSARVDGDLVLPLGRFNRIKIALDGLALTHPAPTAHSQKLRSVDSNSFAAHQPHRMRKTNLLDARLSHRLAMDSPELGDAPVIGSQAALKPHHFHVAITLGF